MPAQWYTVKQPPEPKTAKTENLFPTERNLSFPHFDTYKLHPLDPEKDVTSYTLPGAGATQSRVGYHAQQLSFKEVRSRISFNHLACGQQGRGIYIDAEWNVIGFQVDSSLKPTFTNLLQLPTPATADELGQQPEYPCALSLDKSHWAVSDGAGWLYILETSGPESPFTASIKSKLMVQPSEYEREKMKLPKKERSLERKLTPFSLLSATPPGTKHVQILVTFAITAKDKPKNTATTFELHEFVVDTKSKYPFDEKDEIPPLASMSTNCGWDLPIWAGWDTDDVNEKKSGFIVLCGQEYVKTYEWAELMKKNDERVNKDENLEGGKERAGLGARLDGPVAPPDSTSGGTSLEDPPEEPSSSTAGKGKGKEIAKATGNRRSSARLATSSSTNGDDSTTSDDHQSMQPDGGPYPYSWSQTRSTVNVTIPFPEGTFERHVDVGLISDVALHLKYLGPDLDSPLSDLFSSEVREWFTDIKEKESHISYDEITGLLKIHLAKKNREVRWPSVFYPWEKGKKKNIMEVPETIDSKEKEAMKKKFANLRKSTGTPSTSGDEPQGEHLPLPGLMREEMESEFDEDDDEFGDVSGGMFGDKDPGGKVGRDALVGGYNNYQAWSTSSITLISTPISGSVNDGIIIKSGIDGALFAPQADKHPAKQKWLHESTIPALSFVLSSKKDLRFVKHISTFERTAPPSPTRVMGLDVAPRKKRKTETGKVNTTVLALDAGDSTGGGNMYVYYPPIDDFSAKQGVIRICGGDRGALLGVGEVTVGGKIGILALCEKALVVLNSVLLDD